jgi:hypothetical protein
LTHFTRVGPLTKPETPLAECIAADFTAYLNAWHSASEVYDDELDAQIHRWYADILTDKSRKVWPPWGIPYFSPSSANSDPRELYEKMRGAKRETTLTPPHQGRWKRIGTAIGDTIQRDVLFAEKHVDVAKFTFERNGRGEPVFEDFAKVGAIVEHGGKKFALYGTCDGIMRYVADDGSVIRVGLEVKSKQTTYATTGGYSTRNGPKGDHVKQCVCYSIMYGSAEPVDYYIILYVNGSKKSWNMTEEDREKYPDICAFGVEITDDMRNSVLDHFAGIVAAAETGVAPALDIGKWTFNNFKTACALSLSDEEMAQIEREVAAVVRSGLPDHKKREAAGVLAQIREIRSGRAA